MADHDAGQRGEQLIARWSPAGDTTEQYVVGWTDPSGAHQLARIGADGGILAAPVDVDAQARWGERDDPFRVHRNGDVVWAWFDDSGDTMFRLARIRAGQAPSCAAF